MLCFQLRIDDNLRGSPEPSQSDWNMSISDDRSPIDYPHFNIKCQEKIFVCGNMLCGNLEQLKSIVN